MSDVLRIEHDGPVRIVTMNRPDALNAFSEELHQDFAQMWLDFDFDVDARAVVLTGAGRAFCAGGSMDDFELFANDLDARRMSLRSARRLVDEMLAVRLPVIAAVNGPAVGLGCTLASLCDAVFIADDTYISDPHVTVGLVAGDGGALTLPLIAGLMRAKRYLLTGDRIPASEAVAIGLATEAVPRDEVLATAIAFAHRLSALPYQAIQETKLVINQHLRAAAASVLPFGLAAESQSHDTKEYRAVPEQFRSRER